MGEAVLKHVAKQRGIDLEVDSAGTAGYHISEEPDERYVHAFKMWFVETPRSQLIEECFLMATGLSPHVARYIACAL